MLSGGRMEDTFCLGTATPGGTPMAKQRSRALSVPSEQSLLPKRGSIARACRMPRFCGIVSGAWLRNPFAQSNTPATNDTPLISGTRAMSTRSYLSRRGFAGFIALAGLFPAAGFAAEPLKDIRLDWATYNPVSIILKQNGLLEKEFVKDGVKITWVQSAGSNKALEFLNAGSIDFGS